MSSRCGRWLGVLPLGRAVLLTSLLSSLLSLAALLYLTLALITRPVWTSLVTSLAHWVVSQQWDSSITRSVTVFLDDVSDPQNSSVLLSLLFLFTSLHLIFSLLLVPAVILHRRRLLLPWLTTHILLIVAKIVIFSLCTFITFFIDLLVSVVFPVVSGVVLGLSLLTWRLVLAAYNNNIAHSSSEEKSGGEKDCWRYKLRTALATLMKWWGM